MSERMTERSQRAEQILPVLAHGELALARREDAAA
jgi:hypothetical protein